MDHQVTIAPKGTGRVTHFLENRLITSEFIAWYIMCGEMGFKSMGWGATLQRSGHQVRNRTCPLWQVLASHHGFWLFQLDVSFPRCVPALKEGGTRRLELPFFFLHHTNYNRTYWHCITLTSIPYACKTLSSRFDSSSGDKLETHSKRSSTVSVRVDWSSSHVLTVSNGHVFNAFMAVYS